MVQAQRCFSSEHRQHMMSLPLPWLPPLGTCYLGVSTVKRSFYSHSRGAAFTHCRILVAGALEALCAMAHAHLELGVASPFLVRHSCLQCDPGTWRYLRVTCLPVDATTAYTSFISVYQEHSPKRSRSADCDRRDTEESRANCHRCNWVSVTQVVLCGAH